MSRGVIAAGISAIATLGVYLIYTYHKQITADRAPEEDGDDDEPPVEQVDTEQTHEPLSKKQTKRFANKLAKKLKRTTVHKGVTKRQNRRIDEAVAQLREATGSDESVPEAELYARVRELFGVETSYSELAENFGPRNEVQAGCDVMSACAGRPKLYEAKMLPQELSLVHKMFLLLGRQPSIDADKPLGSRTAVLDLGAGNGCLSLFAMLILNAGAVMIDRAAPDNRLQTELMIPATLSRRMVRFVSDVGDVDVGKLVQFLRLKGIDRVLVVAKHLCGLGTDLAIRFAEQLGGYRDDEGAPIVVEGLLAATCCLNKIDTPTTVEQYCALYPDAGPRAHHTELVATCTQVSTWRTSAHCVEQSKLTPGQVSIAELAEDVLQAPRLLRLRESFGYASQIRFASVEHTLQNRVLMACRDPVALACLETGGRDEAFLEALQAAHATVREHCGGEGAIDLHPKGIVSKRYGYDSTAH